MIMSSLVYHDNVFVASQVLNCTYDASLHFCARSVILVIISDS